jgi:hypothetical protein
VFDELEKHGSYFAVKDAIKRVLPQQYSYLKELREIITEKNTLNDM